MDIKLLSPSCWTDYELIDSGAFEKLERFGRYVIARPEPQAIWNKSLSDAEWQQRADAYFKKDMMTSYVQHDNKPREPLIREAAGTLS